MVHEYKAYRLIPLMTPLFNGWTIPLSYSSQQGLVRIMIRNKKGRLMSKTSLTAEDPMDLRRAYFNRWASLLCMVTVLRTRYRGKYIVSVTSLPLLSTVNNINMSVYTVYPTMWK